MKEITIKLSNWAYDLLRERHMWLILGSECVAMKYAGEEEIYVKTERCQYYSGDKCGMCCDYCEHLEEGECSHPDRPLRCVVDDPKNYLANAPDCTMKYEVK